MYRETRQDEAEQIALTRFLEIITGCGPEERQKLSLLVLDWQIHSAYHLLLRPGFHSLPGAGCPCLDREKFPGNVASVFCVLKVLTRFFEKSFFTCIQRVLAAAPDGKELESLLYGLWLLGRSGVGAWSRDDLSHQKISDRCLTKKYAMFSAFLGGKGIPAPPAKERDCIAPLVRFAEILLTEERFRPLFGEIVPAETKKLLQKQLDNLKRNGYVPLKGISKLNPSTKGGKNERTHKSRIG